MLEEVYTLFSGDLTMTMSVPVQTAMSMRYAPRISKAANIEINAVFFTAFPSISGLAHAKSSFCKKSLTKDFSIGLW